MALTVISTLDLDMAHPGVNIVHAKQYDSSGRVIRAHLMNEGEPWQVPSDAYPVIRYRKTDRKGGFYDTDENGEYAINFPVTGDRSYINIILDVQTLTTAGNVHMEINFYNADAIRVSTFSWTVAVEASAMSDAEVVSSDYFNALNRTIGTIVENYDNAEEYAERAEAAKSMAETYAAQAVSDVPEVVTGWLSSHITNPTSPVVDETLNIAGPGVAAGSKITGNQIMYAIGNQITEPIQMTQNRYISLSGTTCDVTSTSSSNDYECAAIPCSPGDRFLITACGRATAKPWGFVASNKSVLNTANATSTTETVYVTNAGLIAPADAAYLVVNNRKTDRTSISYKGSKTSYSLAISDGVMEVPNGTDLNNLTFPGNYYVRSASSAGIINIPLFGGTAFDGRLTVVAINTHGGVKQVFETSGGFRQTYRSSYIDISTKERVWTEWFYDAPAQRNYQLSNFYGIKIPQNSNLNDYTTIGTYYVETLADSLHVLNTPTFNGAHYAGKVVVEQAIDATKLLQTYLTFENGYVARRTYNNSAWSSWVTDYTVGNEKVSLVEDVLDDNEGGYTFTSGYIALKNNNKNVDLTSVVNHESYETQHTIIECKDGDIFRIVCRMVDGVGKGWFFVDDSSSSTNAVVLQYDNVNTDVNGITRVIAPKNTTKLVVNSISENCILTKKGSGYSNSRFEVSSESIAVERLIKTSGTETFGYIDATTTPISFTRIASNSSYKSQIVPCKPGDIFKINALGGLRPRAWAFLDSNRNAILMAKPNEVCRNTIIVAPENSAYLVINMRFCIDRSGSSPASVNGLGYHSYRCILKPVVDVQNQLETGLKLIEFEDGGIDVSGSIGDVVNLSRDYPHPKYTVYIRSAIIDCKENDVFTLNTYSTDEYKNQYSVYCFVDDSNNILSKQTNTVVHGAVYAPENAAKLILNDIRSEVAITSSTASLENFSYIGKLINSGKLNDASVLIYDNCILTASGDTYQSNDWYTTGFINVQNLYNKIVYVNTKFVINEYTTNKANQASMINRTVVQYPSPFVLNQNTKYIRVSVHYDTPSDELSVTPVENDQLLSIMKSITDLYECPKSFSASIVEAKMRHYMNLRWTPKAPMPVIKSRNTYLVAQPNVEYIGLPYSSLRAVRKYVGCDITLYTFMTAVHNPKSVLYTRIITDGYLGATYYGTVCTVYPGYAIGYGLPYAYGFNIWPRSRNLNPHSLNPRHDEFESVLINDVQPGDLIVSDCDFEDRVQVTNHTKMVIDVIRDRYGRIDAVIIEEGAPPLVGHREISSFNAFKTFIETSSYTLNRYKKLGENNYVKSPFVKGYADEILEDFVYPDIMTIFGDKVCVKAGTDVPINIIDKKSYNMIRIYKDNNPWKEITSINDFTLSGSELSYGTYKIVITDGTNSSECSFIAADINANYNSSTHLLTFSSQNAVPIGAQSYGNNTTNPANMGVANRTYLFSAEERTAGRVNLSNTNLFSAKCPYVNVTFATEYGTEVWWQIELASQTWEPWSWENRDHVTNRTYSNEDLSKYNNKGTE